MDVVDFSSYAAAIKATAETDLETLAEARRMVADPHAALLRTVSERQVAWHLLLARRAAVAAGVMGAA